MFDFQKGFRKEAFLLYVFNNTRAGTISFLISRVCREIHPPCAFNFFDRRGYQILLIALPYED